jgi:anti-sigma B factor antagonist
VDLAIETSSYNGATVLSAGTLRDRLADVVGQRTVIVDLSSVEFLDSSALGALVAASRDLGDAGGSLRLACPPPHVQKVFRITRLADVIPVFADVAEAAG